ncbi:MAG TPA: hypothetical protein VFH73_20135 [Polyangia bacterium]|jgi:hypothetical protein|nr:hypothetical protein [Polyangia bacterium]
MMTAVVAALTTVMTAADGGTAPPGPPVMPPLPSPQQPAQQPPDYRLVRAKDGSGDLLYDATAFSARISRDGSVRLRDKNVTVLSLLPFWPGPPPPGVPTLEGVIRAWGRKAPRPPPSTHDSTLDDPLVAANTTSRYRPDARDACQYPRSCFFAASVVLVGVTFGLDVSDAITRFHGQDPYRYQKARFLTATSELRARMAGRAHAEDLQRSAADLPRRLREIACDDRLTLSERRQVLQALLIEMDGSLDAAGKSAALIRDALQLLSHPDAGMTCPPSPN